MTSCHNHQHCIDDAMNNARNLCIEKGTRLTALREQVLALVWQSHKPLGAYDLIDMLAEASGRRIAPPTVYRALDFLLGMKVIHRINSLNAYIGCPSPSTDHPNYFLICTQCHTASECNDSTLCQHIEQLGQQQQFEIQQQWLEILGCCQECQTTASTETRE